MGMRQVCNVAYASLTSGMTDDERRDFDAALTGDVPDRPPAGETAPRNVGKSRNVPEMINLLRRLGR